MTVPDLTGILDFLRSAEQLKSTLRSCYASTGRQESVAEHSWRLALMAMLLRDEFPELDAGKVLRMCLIHDLGEAIGGDIPAPEQARRREGGASAGKAEQERRDLVTLLEPLPTARQLEFTTLWDEYEAAATPEARLVKALDKLETILQHNQGKNPADFDYAFNLDYGRQYTGGHPVIVELRRLLDEETERRAES
ncbi:MAG TPA: HD domain-containing protein [Gemmatimonadales bacterium]|jgi:putative hydrolase of HD superfamily|nr:HD domain-containing protein [Gemmatimonadales bacterium]